MANSLQSRALTRISAVCPAALPRAQQALAQYDASTDPETIRVALNKCFRDMLIMGSFDNMDLRILLDDNDNLEYWWYNFNNKVLPYFAQHMTG